MWPGGRACLRNAGKAALHDVVHAGHDGHARRLVHHLCWKVCLIAPFAQLVLQQAIKLSSALTTPHTQMQQFSRRTTQ